MRKYFTRHCIFLHVSALVVVPGCLYAGWWQYHVALGGNGLSWVYTVEWPFFAVMSVYMWWSFIHDVQRPLDRFWFAKQRAAADASGTPLHQIPGWAMDKELSKAVVAASVEAARLRTMAIDNPAAMLEERPQGPTEAGGGTWAAGATGDEPIALPAESAGDAPSDHPPGVAREVIDARVVEDRVEADEELDAYNRYLFELSFRDPPKHWKLRRPRSRADAAHDGDPTAADPSSAV